MKFAIYKPKDDGYWKNDGAIVTNWKKAKLFLTREDAEAYVTWIKTEYKYSSLYENITLIVRQVE